MKKSLPETMAILGVTEATLRDWIKKKIAKPKKRPIGKKVYYEFSDEEVERVKGLMRPDWMQGQPKIRRKDDELR